MHGSAAFCALVQRCSLRTFQTHPESHCSSAWLAVLGRLLTASRPSSVPVGAFLAEQPAVDGGAERRLADTRAANGGKHRGPTSWADMHSGTLLTNTCARAQSGVKGAWAVDVTAAVGALPHAAALGQPCSRSSAQGR